MSITADQVKKLRDRTGISVMQCKKALEESEGDIEKALNLLKKSGAEIVLKKSNRLLGAGVIVSYVHNDNKLGVLAEVLCETDFVAKNGEFRQFADDVAMHIAAMCPNTIDDLLPQSFVKEPEITIQNLVERITQKTGEKIEISRFTRMSLLKE